MKAANLLQTYHFWILLACLTAPAMALAMRTDGQGVTVLGGAWPLKCALHEITGIKCAFCGMTRSFSLTAHGQIANALRIHPLGPALFAFICIQIPYRLYRIAKPGPPKSRTLPRLGIITAFLLLLLIFIQWLIYLGGRII